MDKPLSASEDHTSVEHAAADKAACMSTDRQQMIQEAARTVGRELARLREERYRKMDDISAYLKVSMAKLKALEAGDLDHLPDMAFVIGIVRGYAKMLNVDPAPLVDKLRQARGLPEPHLALPGSDGVRLPRHHRPLAWTARLQRRRLWVIVGLCALMFALLVLLLRQYARVPTAQFIPERKIMPKAPAPLQQSSPSTQVQEPQTQDSTVDAMHPQWSVADTSTEKTAEAVHELKRQSNDLSAPALEADTVEPPDGRHAEDTQLIKNNGLSTLHFKVSQNTWISVRQSNNQNVYMGLLSAGEQRDIEGKLPLQIVIGNVAGLETLELDGQLIERSKYKPARNNVARFSLP